MAFSVRITGFAKDSEQVLLDINPSWWEVEELKRMKGFVVIHSAGYLDYSKDVSTEEMRAIHERFRLAASTGVYEYSMWQEINQPKLRALDEALYSRPGAYSHFNILVYEWESGLDW